MHRSVRPFSAALPIKSSIRTESMTNGKNITSLCYNIFLEYIDK